MTKKLIAFDMDGTLINGRLVFALGDAFGVSDKIRTIMSSNIDGYRKTEVIAKLWKGLPSYDVVKAISNIPLMKGTEDVVKELKENGHKVGIISDSYTLATGYIAKKLDMDFHFSNILIENDGVLTGEVRMLMGWEKIGCSCKISVCKRFHLEKASQLLNIDLNDTVAIGDTASDVCMLNRANLGIAFNPKDKNIEESADIVIKKPDLSYIMQYIH